MSMTDVDLTRLLVAVGLLLVGAHAFGQVFARVRQPPVIGEVAVTRRGVFKSRASARSPAFCIGFLTQ
jgi:hypothetical protein